MKRSVLRGSLLVADREVTVKVNVWDDIALGWCEALRVGDVVCLKNMTITLYKSQATASARDVSQVQICYRTRPNRDEDGAGDEHFRPDLRGAEWEARTRRVRELVQAVKEGGVGE
ncbi:hypothetical protein BT69DRAFT_1287914 [Atractiella rhizophila]|nr:hypothetical protein BT69DRAFT_1287914 [Atractiella rhizophila]